MDKWKKHDGKGLPYRLRFKRGKVETKIRLIGVEKSGKERHLVFPFTLGDDEIWWNWGKPGKHVNDFDIIEYCV